MLKKYYQFIKEADQAEKSSTKFTELKDELKSMIEKTVENLGGDFQQFVDSFKKNPEDVKIEGLINDSDIYEFYLKWRNDIDEMLNDLNFFDEIPTDKNAFGLYEYIIKGTETAIKQVVKSM